MTILTVPSILTMQNMSHYYMTILIALIGFLLYNGHKVTTRQPDLNDYPITSKVVECVEDFTLISEVASDNSTDVAKFEKYLFVTQVLTVLQVDFIMKLMEFNSVHMKATDHLSEDQVKLYQNMFVSNNQNMELIYDITNSVQLLHMKSYYMIKHNQVDELWHGLQHDIDLIIGELKAPFAYTFELSEDTFTEPVLNNFEYPNDSFVQHYHKFFHHDFAFTSKCQTPNFSPEQVLEMFHV